MIHGFVDHSIATVKPASEVVFDTSALVIDSAQLIGDSGNPINLKFNLSEPNIYGRALSISLPASAPPSFKLRIAYSTTPESTALQFLSPQQTEGKKHPYLFTQCEAIHARTLVPCQDTPGVKSTYSAAVRVPNGLVALMSAVQDGDPIQENGLLVWNWTQKIPIPAYLIALAVGNLARAEVSPRSAVWTEPETLDRAAWEFEETESFLAAGEALAGPYLWGRYDLLVLPGSFPYGGMENPCLTFVTPTLLAGDRSQVDVVAHEAAHSWSGNLVTNAKWGDFWLNEGFTVFFERKIVGRVYGEPAAQLSALIGLEHLKEDIDNFGPDSPLTALVKNLTEKDPDDAFSSVPYEKGFNFLYFLENLLGGPAVFEPYLRDYIQKFAHKSIDTPTWQAHLFSYFSSSDARAKLEKVDWNAWFYAPGMPPVANHFDDALAKAADGLAARWKEAIGKGSYNFDAEEFEGFNPPQKSGFAMTVHGLPRI